MKQTILHSNSSNRSLSEEELCSAANRYADCMLRSLEEQSPGEINFSFEFNHKIEELINTSVKKRKSKNHCIVPLLFF